MTTTNATDTAIAAVAVHFYAPQLYRQVLLRARISYGNSVCPGILEIDEDNLRTKLNWCCRVSHEH